MRQNLIRPTRNPRAAIALAVLLTTMTVAAPSRGRVAPQGEPGQPLAVSGTVVGPDGAPVAGVSLYVYQTDHEG